MMRRRQLDSILFIVYNFIQIQLDKRAEQKETGRESRTVRNKNGTTVSHC